MRISSLGPFGVSCQAALLWIAALGTNVHAADHSFLLGGHELEVAGTLDGFDLVVETQELQPGLEIAVLTLSRDPPATPPQLTLKWSVPSVDIAGIWTPKYNENSVLPADWSSARLESMLTRNAPVFTLFGHDEINRLTVAVSDAMNHVNLAAKIREEDARIYNSIELFTENHKKVDRYQLQLRLDQRPLPFYRALADVSDWWARQENYTPAPVPEAAREPMYSTWYSYHQDVSHKALIEEVRLARQAGFGAIIVDDGWQTNDSNRGYAFTGDWKPVRLTDMKGFVDEVHALGMKALLWYSLPFVGEQSEAISRFEGKFLNHRERLGAYVLDPRYPEVRDYLIGHYRRAVGEWGWDGLKLDFIDEFRNYEDTVLEVADGRDYASVYEAVDRLMTDVITELRQINPAVMIEFRQRYIGPLMRKYGNMFRATDIPNGAVTNRARTVNLRFLAGNTSVHSDMIMWHPEEPAEIAALQFLNILFSVPQVSVRMAGIPPDHLEMLRHYTNYWVENRDVLLDGDFGAQGIYARYPVVSARSENKHIVGLYANRVIELGDRPAENIDIVNAKKSERVVLDVPVDSGTYQMTIKDHKGMEQLKQTLELNAGVHAFDVPVSGMLSLRR